VLLFPTQRRARFGQPSLFGLLLLITLFPASSAADCIPIAEARQHIGEDQCVSGKVFRVKHAGRGVTLFVSARIPWFARSPWWSLLTI
jgi:hypothetical protein